jgi:hypothetical protein
MTLCLSILFAHQRSSVIRFFIVPAESDSAVQTALAENPFSGHIFVYRGRRGDSPSDGTQGSVERRPAQIVRLGLNMLIMSLELIFGDTFP